MLHGENIHPSGDFNRERGAECVKSWIKGPSIKVGQGTATRKKQNGKAIVSAARPPFCNQMTPSVKQMTSTAITQLIMRHSGFASCTSRVGSQRKAKIARHAKIQNRVA